MKFVVQGRSGAAARAGILKLDSCQNSIETPALLLSTRKGLPYSMTREMLTSLPLPDAYLLQTSPLHFLDCPSMKTISKIGGLHHMVGLHEHGFVAVARDSVACVPDYKSTNKFGASFETTFGRMLVKPTQYVELISTLSPNLWASLADEVPAQVSEKRNKLSVDRTLCWLDDCITLCPAGGEVVLGAIVGGSDLAERKRCAQEVAKRNVSGFWIGGFGLGESMEERPALLSSLMDVLPEEKPRQICGLGPPEEILQGVAAGIDLFDSAYIYLLTLDGFALTFAYSKDKFSPDLGTRNDSTQINLHEATYRKDTSPIVDGCQCYTCQNHTRAYINHLLCVREMLAQTLLEIHNTHHYLCFFRVIRSELRSGGFTVFHQKFIQQQIASL